MKKGSFYIGIIITMIISIFGTTEFIFVRFYDKSSDVVGQIPLPITRVISSLIFLLILQKILKIKINFSLKKYHLFFYFGWPFIFMGVWNLVFDWRGWTIYNNVPPSQILVALMASLLFSFGVGLFEEILIRAGLYNLLKKIFPKKNLWFSIIISSVIFGSLHMSNYASSGFWDTTNQLMYAVGSGILFSMIYYLTDNLSLPILLHTWVNFTEFFARPQQFITPLNVTSGVDIYSVILTIILISHSIFLYKNRNRVSN